MQLPDHIRNADSITTIVGYSLIAFATDYHSLFIYCNLFDRFGSTNKWLIEYGLKSNQWPIILYFSSKCICHYRHRVSPSFFIFCIIFYQLFLCKLIYMQFVLTRGNFKTQPVVDWRFHPVPVACHCVEQWKLLRTRGNHPGT